VIDQAIDAAAGKKFIFLVILIASSFAAFPI
jgi:hypothetical protein